MYAKKRSPLSWLVPLIVVLLLVAVAVFVLTQFTLVGIKLYPKDAEVLDLRGEELSVKDYQKLAKKLPDCEILWNIPFQGQVYSSDTETVTVTSLREEDLKTLACFTQLEMVDARACTDYELLMRLEDQNPSLTVEYQIALGDRTFDRATNAVTLTIVTEEELPRLDLLKSLETVTVAGEGSQETIARLREYCAGRGLALHFQMAGQNVDVEAEELTVTGITDEDLPMIPLLENLKKLHLASPKAAAENIFSLPVAYPQITITWDYTLGDKTLPSDTEDVDLSGVKLTSVEEVEAAMAYFPEAKTVFLGVQDGLKNDDVAAFRERVRSQYKVVWEVRFGDTKTMRTDVTYFMPGRDWARGPAFGDAISYNLRYCEDLICVDVGHLGAVKEVSWLEGLHNLEYLILAHTDIRSLEGIQNCKKLKFLELDWTGIKDLTPLKECTALEDLNIGKAYPDVTPLLEMPWLKNVYMIFGSSSDAYKISQALPDTHVVCSGNATVASGWRNLPNYYAMRDALHAPYMKG